MNNQKWWDDSCKDASKKGVEPGTFCPKAGAKTNYASQPLLKYCVPAWSSSDDSEKKTYYEHMKEKFFESEEGKVLQDATSTWKTNLILIVTGLIISFLFMWLMSKCARCLAMCGIAIMLLSFFGGGAACLFMGLKSEVVVSDDPEKGTTKNIALLVTGGVFLFMGLCTVCCIWCNRTSLETAIAIIDASADFMIDTKRLIFVSVFYFIITMIIFFLWLFAVASVFSLVPFKANEVKGSQVK